MDTHKVEVAIGRYTLICQPDSVPEDCDFYRAHASLVEEHGLSEDRRRSCLIAVRSEPIAWPFLVLSIAYTMPGWPTCGALIVPETHKLFVGVDELVLINDLSAPVLLRKDRADFGFWSWYRHEDSVLMAAELEMAAWDIHGRKRWTAFVEPPWQHIVSEDIVHLTVLDLTCSFPLDTGPDWGATLPWQKRQ
jgi:hypothetical protein